MSKVTTYVWILIWIFSTECLNVSSEEKSGCEEPWDEVQNSCVQFIDASLTWQEARNSCLNIDSDLFSVSNQREFKDIRILVNRYKSSPTDYHNWWIGLRLVNGTFQWVEKNNTLTLNWAPDSAINSTLSGNWCVVLNYQGYFAAMNCTEQKYYICEKIKQTEPAEPTTPPWSTVTPETTTAGTPYPIPTPHTGTPNTRPPETKSTQTPGAISTTVSATGSQSTDKQTTKRTTNTSAETTTNPPTNPPTETTTNPPTSSPTNSPTERTTNKPITKSSTDATTGQSTHKQTTEELTSPNKTPTTITEPPSKMTTQTSTEKQSTANLTDSSTETPVDNITAGNLTEGTTEMSTENQTTDLTTRRSTKQTSSGRSTGIQGPTTKIPKAEEDEFLGCFAVNHESTCPPVEAFGISWPRSEAGKMVKVPCNKGFAKWKCDKKPTCWRGEPDVKQCTSESVQELTTQMEEFLSNTSNSEKAVEYTENLANSVESEMSEKDILQLTNLMEAASKAEPKNSSEAWNIIKNIVKCGSGLVEKKETWVSMNEESMRTVASSLIKSVDSVTKNMLTNFDEPTVEKIVEKNMEIELQVIDVNQDEANDTTFQADSNSFAISTGNLIRFSRDGIARVVFINYNKIGEYMVPVNKATNNSFERQLISHVISASLPEKPAEEQLIEPILFTMRTENIEKNRKQKRICSFWNFNLGYNGIWSEDGCSLKEYNDTHATCQCDHLTNFAVLMDIHSIKITPVHAVALSYVTYAGLIISIICLFFSWITFVCLSIRCMRGTWSSSGNAENNEHYGNSGSSYSGSAASSRSTQGERNSIHKNLVFCLFIAEVLFLAGIERADNKVACAIIAGFLHYFFLSSFTWMLVEGIHIIFMLVQVFDAARSRLKYYYMIGYGAPLLIIGISALVYYEGYGTERYCWLTPDRMFIWSFAGPVALILLVNLIILIYAMVAVWKHSEYVFTKGKSSNFKAWIQGALAMEVLLGLTWIFGYLYITEEAIPIAYLFTIFNSLQGLFIFVYHCLLNKKVRKAYARFIDYPRRTVTSGTHSTKVPNHSSSNLPKSTYRMNGSRKHSRFLDLRKNRRPSSMSTTSA